jgi:hypothetical protein
MVAEKIDVPNASALITALARPVAGRIESGRHVTALVGDAISDEPINRAVDTASAGNSECARMRYSPR